MNFEAFAFRQLPGSPIQIVFVASSSSIDTWAKVPTKLSNRPVGFQRAAIPQHVREVKTFFADEEKRNCSPTAILLGIEPEARNQVSLTRRDGSPLKETDVGQTPVECCIEINFTPWRSADFPPTYDEEIEKLFQQVEHLYPITASVNLTKASEDNEDDDEELEAVLSDGEDEDDDEDEPKTEPGDEDNLFFAHLRPEQLASAVRSGDFRGWDKKRKERLREILKDDRKIGIIIDGQHRVKGTAASGQIPFVVSLLPYADWPELAFQFIVNNGTAKKVDAGLLISIVGESLRPDEVAATQGRLYRSGVQVKLIQAVMRVQTQENPFNGMLKFGISGEDGFLDAPAMQKKVIKLWYGSRGRSGQRPTYGRFKLSLRDAHDHINMGEIFGPSCEGANISEKARDWQDNRWFEYFVAFWRPIASHFAGDLWPRTRKEWPTGTRQAAESKDQQEIRKRLMRVTVLGLLQEAIIDAWWRYSQTKWEEDESDTSKRPAIQPSELEAGIQRFVKRIPKEFFTELRFSGFDASRNTRGDLQEQLLKLLDRKGDYASLRNQHKFWKP